MSEELRTMSAICPVFCGHSQAAVILRVLCDESQDVSARRSMLLDEDRRWRRKRERENESRPKRRVAR